MERGYHGRERKNNRAAEKKWLTGVLTCALPILLIDVILEGKCNCCKEIYYQASLKDPSIGPATVYRMVNTLEQIGAISRKNMYRISDDGNKMECMVELEDGTVLDLPEDKWTAVIKSGLDACGFSGGQNVRNITLKEA